MLRFFKIAEKNNRVKLFKLLCAVMVVAVLGGCAPQVVKETVIVEKPVEKVVKETVIVQSASEIVEKVVTATPVPEDVAAASGIKRGGTLTYVRRQATDSLDPHLSTLGDAAEWSLLFDPLLLYKWVGEGADAQIEILPGLAESFDVLEPTLLEFKLREGVKFHDGSAFNAAVAKWNVDRVLNAAESKVQSTLSTVEEAIVVDDYTLQLKLSVPSPLLPLMLTPNNPNCLYIVSQEAVENMTPEYFAAHPVGSGPMKLKEFIRDDRIVLERFPGHWELGEDGQPLPYYDTFVSRLMTDQSVALVELRSGNVDVFTNVLLQDVETVEASPDLEVRLMPGAWKAYPSLYFSSSCEDCPFTLHKELRYAAEYATDRDAFAEALGFGWGEPQYYWSFFPGMPGYDESLPKREYDLEKAKQLVVDAGYPDGVDISVKIINRTSDVQPLEVLQAMWAKAGIRLNIELLDRVVWMDDGRAGNFEALSHGNSSILDPLIRQQTRTGMLFNWSGYSGTEMDALWDQAEVEYDSAKREELYHEMVRLQYEEAYWLSAFRYPLVAGINKDVRNFQTQWEMRWIWLDR